MSLVSSGKSSYAATPSSKFGTAPFPSFRNTPGSRIMTAILMKSMITWFQNSTAGCTLRPRWILEPLLQGTVLLSFLTSGRQSRSVSLEQTDHRLLRTDRSYRWSNRPRDLADFVSSDDTRLNTVRLLSSGTMSRLSYFDGPHSELACRID